MMLILVASIDAGAGLAINGGADLRGSTSTCIDFGVGRVPSLGCSNTSNSSSAGWSLSAVPCLGLSSVFLRRRFFARLNIQSVRAVSMSVRLGSRVVTHTCQPVLGGQDDRNATVSAADLCMFSVQLGNFDFWILTKRRKNIVDDGVRKLRACVVSAHGIVNDHIAIAGERFHDVQEDTNPMTSSVVSECQDSIPFSSLPDRVDKKMHWTDWAP
jgi:hypothetical protein